MAQPAIASGSTGVCLLSDMSTGITGYSVTSNIVLCFTQMGLPFVHVNNYFGVTVSNMCSYTWFRGGDMSPIKTVGRCMVDQTTQRGCRMAGGDQRSSVIRLILPIERNFYGGAAPS